MADQRVVTGTLADIAERVRGGGRRGAGDHDRRRRSPACASELAWRERRPLAGRRIVVTRARPQASGLAATLTDLGADRHAGARHRDPPGRRRAPRPDRLRPRLPHERQRRRPAVRARARRAVPRRADDRRDRARGPPSGCASTASSRTWSRPARSARGCSRRSPASTRGARIVLRAREGRDVLPDGLRERGVEVDVVTLYETRPEPLDERDARRRPGRGLDHVHRGLGGARRSWAPSAARTRCAAGRGSPRSARSRARPCARPAWSRTSRPPSTRPTAWSPRSSAYPASGGSPSVGMPGIASGPVSGSSLGAGIRRAERLGLARVVGQTAGSRVLIRALVGHAHAATRSSLAHADASDRHPPHRLRPHRTSTWASATA